MTIPLTFSFAHCANSAAFGCDLRSMRAQSPSATDGENAELESVPSSYTVLDHIDGSLPKGAIIDMGSGQTQWKMEKSETEITMNNAKQLSAIDSYN
eukprot:scaffold108757_cov60-Cyclotella_meneghiniana.AAC.3